MDEALREKPFVLVVGDSLAGKSRTAYEAARRLTRDGVKHDPVVLVPKGAASIGRILDLDFVPQRVALSRVLALAPPASGDRFALAAATAATPCALALTRRRSVRQSLFGPDHGPRDHKPEAAAALLLSPKSIEFHLGKTCGRLGVPLHAPTHPTSRGPQLLTK